MTFNLLLKKKPEEKTFDKKETARNNPALNSRASHKQTKSQQPHVNQIANLKARVSLPVPC
jgi:hypothetical protein